MRVLLLAFAAAWALVLPVVLASLTVADKPAFNFWDMSHDMVCRKGCAK